MNSAGVITGMDARYATVNNRHNIETQVQRYFNGKYINNLK
jgi:hypothetical protein